MNVNSSLRQMWFWRCRSPEFAFVCLWFLIAIEVARDFFYLLFPLIQVLFWSTCGCYVSESSFLYFANECWILGFCSYLIKVALKLFQMARFFNLRYILPVVHVLKIMLHLHWRILLLCFIRPYLCSLCHAWLKCLYLPYVLCVGLACVVVQRY